METMERINIGDGRWFAPAKAACYEESTWWDGRNNISCATGSQWEHEELYHTASGTWILHRWSQWQGSGASYEVVDADTAHGWLIDNGHGDAVPPAELAAAEL